MSGKENQNPIKKYRPSNGTEGDGFQAEWCYRCTKDNHHTEEYCPILGNTMAFEVEDPEYPEEWRYTEDGHVCTAFEIRQELDK